MIAWTVACQAPLGVATESVTREMQIKITERYHHIPITMVNIRKKKKKLTTPRVGDNAGKLEFSYTVGI